FKVDPARVVVIHNGIDPDRFRRTQAREALARRGVREPYVRFVGRITDQKGIFHLLEAAPKLPQGVQVVLCASAPYTPEIAAALRRLLDAPARGRAMGRAGRLRVEPHFAWSSVAERTREVYAAAIDEFARTEA